MSLSRRGFLFALGLALPAATLVSVEAEATTRTHHRTGKPHTQTQAHAKPSKGRKPKAHASNHRRRRAPTTV